MSTVAIKIEGVDITASVLLGDAEFTSLAKGTPGTATFRIKDTRHTHLYSTGNEVTLDIDGIRKWGGYITQISRGYFWDGSKSNCKDYLVPRYLRIEATDYSWLLSKRVLYDHGDGSVLNLAAFAAGTTDQEIILYYLENYTDLAADGITFDLVEHVGTPAVDDVWQGNSTWSIDQLLHDLNRNIGAVYYITPNKELVWTDVDTTNASQGISDAPIAGEVGARDVTIENDGSKLRNDALVFGVGQGSKSPVFARTTDSASVTEHGLWQDAEFNQILWRQTTADRIADSIVYGSPQNKRGGKDDRVAVRATVFTPEFEVAQKVNVRSEVWDFEDVLPIRQQTITFPTPTDAKYDLTISHEIDEPWSTVEFWWPKFPDIGPIRWPVPMVLPPTDPCADGNCEEHFARVEASGLGTSEFGGGAWTAASWASVTGDEALLANFFNGSTRLDVTIRNPTDIRLRVRFAHRTGTSPNSADLWFMLSNQTTAGGTFGAPFNGQYHGWEVGWRNSFVYCRFVNYPGQPPQNGVTEQVFGITSTSIDPLGYMWVRWRNDDSGEYLKFWADGDPEPLTWQANRTVYSREDAYLWLFAGPSNIFGNPVSDLIYVDYFQFTEGLLCNGTGTILDYPTFSTTTEDASLDVEDLNVWYIANEPYPGQVSIPLNLLENVSATGGFINIAMGPLVVLPDKGTGGNWDFAYMTGGHAAQIYYHPAVVEEMLIKLNFPVLGNFGILNISNGYWTPDPSSGEREALRVGGHSVAIYMPQSGGFPGSDHAGLFGVTANGGGGTVPYTLQSGQDYFIRINSSYATAAKIWKTSDSEPIDWTVIASNPAGAPGATGGLGVALGPVSDDLYLPGGSPVYAPSSVEIQLITITHTTNPCGGQLSAADPPCEGQQICETMDMVTPDLVYASSYQWIPGSDEVWVDGLRMDYRDYEPTPSSKRIQFNNALSADTHIVRICYVSYCAQEGG